MPQRYKASAVNLEMKIPLVLMTVKVSIDHTIGIVDDGINVSIPNENKYWIKSILSCINENPSDYPHWWEEGIMNQYQ